MTKRNEKLGIGAEKGFPHQFIAILKIALTVGFDKLFETKNRSKEYVESFFNEENLSGDYYPQIYDITAYQLITPPYRDTFISI